MNKNELRNTILSQIQLPCIGKNRMQVEPVSGQMQTRQLQQAIDDLSWRGGGTLVCRFCCKSSFLKKTWKNICNLIQIF